MSKYNVDVLGYESVIFMAWMDFRDRMIGGFHEGCWWEYAFYPWESP